MKRMMLLLSVVAILVASACAAFAAYPEKPITGQTIRRSLRARAAYSERAEHGVVYDRALRQRIADEVGAGRGEL